MKKNNNNNNNVVMQKTTTNSNTKKKKSNNNNNNNSSSSTSSKRKYKSCIFPGFIYFEPKLLPVDFIPSPFTIVCGKSKKWVDGINWLQNEIIIANKFAEMYANADNDKVIMSGKLIKTKIVCDIVKIAVQKSIEIKSPPFVRHDFVNDRFEQMDEHDARIMVSTMIRNCLHTKYRSSNKSKHKNRIQAKKQQQSNCKLNGKKVASSSIKHDSSSDNDDNDNNNNKIDFKLSKKSATQEELLQKSASSPQQQEQKKKQNLSMLQKQLKEINEKKAFLRQQIQILQLLKGETQQQQEEEEEEEESNNNTGESRCELNDQIAATRINASNDNNDNNDDTGAVAIQEGTFLRQPAMIEAPSGATVFSPNNNSFTGTIAANQPPPPPLPLPLMRPVIPNYNTALNAAQAMQPLNDQNPTFVNQNNYSWNYNNNNNNISIQMQLTPAGQEMAMNNTSANFARQINIRQDGQHNATTTLPPVVITMHSPEIIQSPTIMIPPSEIVSPSIIPEAILSTTSSDIVPMPQAPVPLYSLPPNIYEYNNQNHEHLSQVQQQQQQQQTITNSAESTTATSEAFREQEILSTLPPPTIAGPIMRTVQGAASHDYSQNNVLTPDNTTSSSLSSSSSLLPPLSSFATTSNSPVIYFYPIVPLNQMCRNENSFQ